MESNQKQPEREVINVQAPHPSPQDSARDANQADRAKQPANIAWDAKKAERNKGTHVRLHIAASGVQDMPDVKSVNFEHGFVVIEDHDGRRHAFPGQALNQVEFGPHNLAWD